MRKSLILFICIIAAHIAVGQGVGVGTTTPHASAKLDVSSTTQGMLVPRMTTAQRTTIPTPATGLLVFDMTTNSFWFKGGTMWIELVDSSNIVVQKNGSNIYMGLNGNVGIGTNTPTTKLEVLTPTNTLGITHTDGDIRLSTRITDTSAIIRTTTEHPITLQAGSSVTNFTLPPSGGAYIGSGNQTPTPGTTLHVEGNTSLIGLVGVGTGSPTSKLDVKTTALFPALTLRNENVTLNVVMESDTAVIKTATASAIQLNANNGTNHLTIASSGMVGIGNSAPDLPLSFGSAFGGKIALKKTAASYFGFGVNPGALLIHSDGPGSDILFGHNSGVFAELARMKGTGRFGIGTNNPTAMLSVIRGTSPDGTAAFLGSTHNSYFNKGSNEDTYINGGKAGSNVLLNSAGGLGFVGIGTTSPLQMLHVAGGGFFGGALGLGIVAPLFPLHFSPASGDKLALSGSPGAFFGFGIQPNLMQVIAPSTAAIGFGTGSSNAFNEKMRLTGDGNLGIGTQNPSSKLDVNGDVNISGGLVVGLGVAIAGGLGVGGAVGIGTPNPPDPSSILELNSTTKGFLYPRMSSTQRDAIPSPPAGLTVYDNTTNSPWYHDGNTWKEMKPDPNSDTPLVFRNGPDMIYMGLTDRVGVGTNTPAYKLQVKTGANMDGISHTDGNIDVVTRVSDDHGGSIGTKSNHNFELFANNGESQFIIKPNGNIGIGGDDELFATLTVQRDPENIVGSMEVKGTTYYSVFSNGPMENTIINGGKANSNVLINNAAGLGNVGIGTDVPLQKLHVGGNVAVDGNVGIGTSTPAYKLQVVTGDNMEGINHTNGNVDIVTRVSNDDGGSIGTKSNHNFELFANNGESQFIIKPNGNIGIGGDDELFATLTVQRDPENIVGSMEVKGTTYYSVFSNGPMENTIINGGKANSNVLINNVAGLGNVGIGTTDPFQKLHVQGNTYISGDVGIGVTAPTATMEIARGTGNSGTLMIKGTTQASHFNFSTAEHTYIRGGKANSNVLLNDVAGLGNVGIGTATPFQKLHVEGITYISQKLGIGNNLPNAPLQFNNDANVNRKIVLYEGTPNDHQYYGLGINPSAFRYQVSNENDNHVFYAGSNATSSKELMRIHGSGNVGIGGIGAIPANKLDIRSGPARTGTHESGRGLYVTSENMEASNGVEFRHFNGTQGIGFGYNTIYATGSDAVQNLGMKAKGATGNVILSTNETERMRVTGNGNVGIGVTNPGSTLEIARGTAEFGTMQINGTTYNSHINYGSPEDTYIRGGKAGAKVIINEYGGLGNVGIGTANPLQKLHVSGNVAVDNNVGIGNTAPHAPLQFNSANAIRKIVLHEWNDNDHEFTGFGTSIDGLRYQIFNTEYNHIFSVGASSSGSNELMRITGTGKVGIGDTNPAEKLSVNGNVDVSGAVLIGYQSAGGTATVNPQTTVTISCDCPPGTKALAGGWSGAGLTVTSSHPASDGTKWFVTVTNESFFDQHGVNIYVNCARIGN